MKIYFTQWFEYKVKPVRTGIYQRLGTNYQITYSYWNGKKWGSSASIPKYAFQMKEFPSISQHLYWRGLTE